MPLIIIGVGLILRSLAPVLFYIVAIAFIIFLCWSSYGSIKEQGYGIKEGITTVVYILGTLLLMFA